MTSREQPTEARRRRSALADEQLWEVPGKPPAPAAAQPSADRPADERTPVRADARTREMRGHARDLAEARGRKQVRDAVYAWAAAARKARDRQTEFVGEHEAAIARGTDAQLLADYITEACDRYGLDPNSLPPELRARIKPAP